MSEEVRRLNILRHIAHLSKRLPHCQEPPMNQNCSSLYKAHYLGCYHIQIFTLLTVLIYTDTFIFLKSDLQDQ